MLKNCGRSMKWKEPAVNRMLSVMIKRRANTFFMIVQRKVLKAAEVFVTTVKRWRQGKNINQKDSAIDMAAAMGIELLTEEQYRELQKLGEFDTKTSSWVKTPADIRKLGGAIFCDRRYDTCLRVSQRCGILLCRQGIPWLAKGLRGPIKTSFVGEGLVPSLALKGRNLISLAL